MKMHEISSPRDALERILISCNRSTQYTRRTQSIHEAAMRGLGMTESQRQARHMAIFARLGDDVGRQSFTKRRAELAEYLEDHRAKAA